MFFRKKAKKFGFQRKKNIILNFYINYFKYVFDTKKQYYFEYLKIL